MCGRWVEEEDRLQVGIVAGRFIAGSLGAEIESKAYVGETSGRHSETLSLLCVCGR